MMASFVHRPEPLYNKTLFTILLLDIIYIGLIAIAFAVGLIFTYRSGSFNYKLLLLFLLITFLNESVCLYIKNRGLGSTYIFYNFYYYFRYPVLACMFLYLFTDKFQRIFIYIFFLLSFFLLFFNFFYYYKSDELHTNYQLAGGFFIIILCLFYFYNIIRMSNMENPLKTKFFWVATGFFFFFLGTLPFFGILRFLVKKDILFAEEYLVLVKSLSILLYSFIGIDFYIQWKYQK